MADAAVVPSDPSSGGAEEEDDDACRICHLPAEAERPLRHPCACRGTIRFVHDDCLLRWLATRRISPSRCEVCKHVISVAPVYAPNAPTRLPLPEFMLGLANKLTGWLFLLLSLLFAIYVWDFVMPLTTVWVWRLALSRNFAQVRRLLSLRFSVFPGFHSISFMPSPDTVLACVSIRRAFLRELPNLRQLNAPARIAADALAPFALWIARVEAHLQTRFGGLDTLQVFALHIAEAALIVVIGDVIFAFVLGFLPFSLGRIVLWSVSCFSFGNMDVDGSYASTAAIILIGYGLIMSLVLLFTGMHTFQQYSRGEQLTITIFFELLLNCLHWLFIPFRLLPEIHVMVNRTSTFSIHFIAWTICLLNSSLNLTLILLICPLFFGWSLDISTSKLFGVTISQKLKLIFASSYASTALHWLIGCICLKLRSFLSSFLHPVLSLRASIPFVHSAGGQIQIPSILEPFYKFYFKMLPDLLFSIIYVTMFVLVPVEIVFRLEPAIFPFDIIYFNPPTQGTALWQSPRSYAELISGLLLVRFLICSTLKYLEPGVFVEKVLRYWFAIMGQAVGLSEFFIAPADGAGESNIGGSATPKDQYGEPNDAKDKRKYVNIRMAIFMVMAWLTVVVFNSTVLVAPVSVGRALLFAIPQLPVAGALKCNDLFAFAVGFCIICTIIAASRGSFTHTASVRRHLRASAICNWGVTALKSTPLLFIWIVIIPCLIGLLVDCLLLSPFVVSASDVPVLDFFCIWFLGTHLLKFWSKLVHWTRVVPFLAYLIDERWGQKLTQVWEDGFSGLRATWIMEDVLMPISVNLLLALCVPYVLAKCVFPRFGYSAAMNCTVQHFAWLGCLAICVLYHIGKFVCRFFVKLHDSIRDERYLIGQRLQNYADNG